MIIPNMYNIKISCKDSNDNASYNINIDTDVTITATVLDFNGEPVIGKSLTIYYDDETSIYTGTTNSNGQISTTYTCTEWGIHTFSIESYSIQINVVGWRIPVNDANYTLKYNQYMVSASIHVASSVSVTPSTEEFGFDLLKDSNHLDIDLRPNMPITQYLSNGALLWIADNSYRMKRKSPSSSTFSVPSIYANFSYVRK